MNLSRRTMIAAASALPLVGARAQGTKPVLKIGCLTDLSGPYKDLAGPGAVSAMRQAAKASTSKC
jgi:branched-chain amino acid transport system substrate-binding protein